MEEVKKLKECVLLDMQDIENKIGIFKDATKGDKNFFNGVMRIVDTIEALQQENEQLQAQMARMREALEQFKYDYEQDCPIYPNYLAVCQLLREDTGINYHNPADVAEIERLNGLVGCGCGICLAHNNMICPRLVKKDKAIGGGQDDSI